MRGWSDGVTARGMARRAMAGWEGVTGWAGGGGGSTSKGEGAEAQHEDVRSAFTSAVGRYSGCTPTVV